MRQIIPIKIEKILIDNPSIGRDRLARDNDISNQKARFYIQLFREMHKSKPKVIKRGVALFDIHYPYHDKASMSIVKQFIADFKPYHLIYGGDQLDLGCISHHNKGKVRLTENTRLKKDYKGFQEKILTPIEKVLPRDCKKYFMIGNHEYWVERLIDDNPQLEGLVEVEENLDLSKYSIIPFNESLTIGDMTFIHGIYCSKYFAEKTVGIYGTNVFCGHLHSNQVFTKISPLKTLPKSGVGVGCLCNKNPEYMKNKPNAWIHQFLYFYIYDDGSFTYYTPTIINGRVVINNKLYMGDKSA